MSSPPKQPGSPPQSPPKGGSPQLSPPKPGSPQLSPPKNGSPQFSPPKGGSPLPGSPPSGTASSPTKSGSPSKLGSPPMTSVSSRPGSPPTEAVSKQSRRSSKSEKELGNIAKAPARVAVEEDEEYYTRPDFIYGGPFISVSKPSPFLDTATPMNIPLQGTFKKSFAYFSLKDRLPVILTKIIDYLAREGQKIKSANSASDEDIRIFMESVAKLKNDLVTNKSYDPMLAETAEAKKWNDWIAEQDMPKYFNNVWLFSECYAYRKLKDACEITKGLKNFDYFEEQKNKSFDDNVELMCIVADRMMTMINKSDKDKRKADFMTLLKICLWANKCDLSLSLGEQVSLAKDADKKEESPPPPPPPPATGKGGKEAAAAGPVTISSDPFQMIIDLKDKLLVDETAKIADQVVTKAENMTKAVNANTTFKFKCSCHRLATAAGVPLCKDDTPPPPPPEPKKEEEKEGEKPKEEAPKQIPCPAKMTVPQAVMFDIVCDNTGYELFADLCLAHFLIAQKIVQKVRFHVKNMPWFVSDVTPKDFQFVIDSCIKSNFSKEVPTTGAAEGDAGEPKVIKADNLRVLGEQWNQFVKDGVFAVMDENFWTYPHAYKDMKKYDYNMYRKLQYAVAIMFKGDLNYRKLLADRNCNPSLGFEAALQGFIPAPIIAVRTVKAELICGLPRGKWDQLNKIDEKWMQKGDYGVIQYCPKGEALKVADRPCMDYCETCFGVICPEHTDI